MAYSTTNPPVMMTERLGGNSAMWSYRSVDAETLVDDAGYITNAKDLGMKAGDVVFAVDTDASPIVGYWHIVLEINTDGSADLSEGLPITA